MEKQIIIQIKDKRATLLSENAEIVCGNSDYKAKFEFNDDDFSAYGAKTALFVYGKQSTAVVFEGDICPIPPLADCSFCLIGVIAGDVKTTTGAKVPCVASIGDMGDTPLPPTEDVYNQIMEIIGKLDPENTLDEEKIKELIKEVIEGEGIGGVLTVDEVKEIVATETKGKFTPSVESVTTNSSQGGTITYLLWGATPRYAKIQVSKNLEANGIVVRDTYNIITADAIKDDHAPTFKQLKEYTAPIAENTKRIENLESTLLTYVEDTASAYEKPVPVDVAPNAILDMVGGASYSSKNAFNPALLDSSNYTITDNGGILYLRDVVIDGVPPSEEVNITLNAGTWYISASGEGNVPSTLEAYDENGSYINAYPITLEARQTISLRWYYEVEGIWEKPFYIMLSQTENAPYEPYFEGERYAPVTAIKSYGANLFDVSQIPEMNGKIEKTENGLIVKGYAITTTFTPEQFLEMTGLKEGDTFTFSQTVEAIDGDYSGGDTGNFVFYSTSMSPILFFGGKNASGYREHTKTIPANFNSQNVRTMTIFGTNTTTFQFSNCMLVKGSEAAEYNPYTTEPIDTYTIPTQIQALEGYGKEGFVIDFDSKTATYQGKTTDVSAYLTDYATFKSLLVQGGGKLIFENTYKYAVPTTLTYVKRKE